MTDPTSYEANFNTIKYFSSKVYRRCKACGVHDVGFEDVVQEMSIAYIKARDAFNVQAGASFKTYLISGMRFHANAWLRKLGYRVWISNSLDEVRSDESQNELHQVIADTAPGHDEKLAGSQVEEAVLGRLLPLSRLVISLLQNPPDLLVHEHRAMRAKAKYALKRGMIIATPKEINLMVIFLFLGLSNQLRLVVRRDIRETVMKVNGWERL